MRIAFFVNAIESETSDYTTTSLAIAALARGHEVCYVTPGDFVLRPNDSLAVRVTTRAQASRRVPMRSLQT